MFQLNEVSDALNAYTRVLSLNSHSMVVRENLHLIYNQFVEKGKEFVKEKKYQQAVVIYERALQIERTPTLLEETAKLYKVLREFEKSDMLLAEFRSLLDQQKNQDLETERLQLIVKGKEYSKRKQFIVAIKYLESAARIKLDKDVFMYLAHLYKGLKRTRALQDLMHRWQQVSKISAANQEEEP